MQIIECGYGRKYADMVCTFMQTKSGQEGIWRYQSMELPEAAKLLKGTGRLPTAGVQRGFGERCVGGSSEGCDCREKRWAEKPKKLR